MDTEFIDLSLALDDDDPIEITRGRDSFVGPVQMGEQTFTIRDPAGVFNPTSKRSPLYGRVLPAKPVRIIAPACPAPLATHVLNDAPASLWGLDLTSGTTVSDSVGGVNGTLNGAAALKQPSLYAYGDGYSVGFDGASAYISFGDRYDFAGTSPFTVEAWLRPTTVDATPRRIWSKEAASDGWGVYHSASGLTVARSAAGTDACTYATPLAPNTPYHVAATYDGTSLRLYLNGVLVAGPTASTRSLPGNTAPLVIGRQAATASNYFAGQLDLCAVYNTALSPARVLAHYQAGQWPEPVYTDTTQVPLWTGILRRIYQHSSRQGRTVLTAVDGLVQLSKARPAQGTTLVGGAASNMIGRILDAVNWPAAMRRIDGSLGGTLASVNTDGATSALDYVDQVNQIEQGFCFIASDGAFVFKRRGWRAGLVPAGSITNTMSLQDAEVDEELVINKAVCTRSVTSGTPTPQVYQDTSSISQYGESTFELESALFASDAAALALATFVVQNNARPTQRVRSITIENRTPALTMHMLTRDLADKIMVSEAEKGTRGEYTIEAIRLTLKGSLIACTWALTAFPS